MTKVVLPNDDILPVRFTTVDAFEKEVTVTLCSEFRHYSTLEELFCFLSIFLDPIIYWDFI